MASLLSFVKRAAHDVTHNPITNAAAATLHGLNPLDNGQGYTTAVPQNAPQQSVVQQAANLGRGIAHPFSTFGSAVIHTPQAIGREIQNKPIYDIQKTVFGTTNPTSIAKQIVGDTASVGLTAAAPGISKGIEAPISKILPAAVPKIVASLTPKVVSNAAIGGGFGGIGAAGQGGNVKQVLKGTAQTAAIGGALPLGIAAGKGTAQLARNAHPLNEVGAVGKNPISNEDANLIKKSLAQEAKKRPLSSDEQSLLKIANQPNEPNLAGLTPEKVNQINAKAYKGPNLNEQAFTAADQKLVGDSMTREAKQITPEDRQLAQMVNISPARARTVRVRPSYPNQRQVMVNKALESKTPTELPPTPIHEGDLTPLQNIPMANKLFSNKINAIRKIGTPSAHSLADTVQRTDRTSEALRAQYMSKIPTVQKLSKDETSQMFDVVEKKAPKDVSPKVIQAAKEWQKLTPQIAQNAFKQGALIGERKNYVPHSYSADFWTKRSGSQYDSAIQHLMDTNKVDHEQAIKLFDNLANSSTKPNWFSNFENARLTDLPGYAKDKSTLYKYIEGAANRTASAQHLGLNNEVANKLLQNIRVEGGDVGTAKKAVENYLHSADTGTGAKTLRGIRGAFGTARLGTAAISHMGQTSNVAVDSGVSRTLKGWGQFLRNNPGHKDFIAKTGVTNPQVLHGYQDQFTSVKGLMSKVTAPGLNQVMKVNRSVSALAYRDYGNALAKAGKEAELRKLGVTGKIGKSLTPEQEVQAARGGVNRTMFSPSRASTPTYAETPAGKLVGQYRTAYAYKQTGFIYDRILKEAKAGNIKPLLRYLTVSAGVGAATIQTKKMISGSKEGPGGKGLDVAAALGGIPGEVAAELARYGARGGIKGLGAVAGAVAPVAGEAVNAYDNVSQALHGKPQAAERYLLGAVPVVGGRLSKTLVPPKNVPTSKTASNNTTTNAKGKTVKMPQRMQTANSSDRQQAWEHFTAKAKKNIALNNPGLYTSRQSAEIQKEQAQGQTTKAFKDQRDLSKLQITRNYDKNLVGAYGLNATDFKAFVDQANSDQLSQLHNLDNQLVSAGLVAKSKFPKPKSSKSGSSRVATGRRGRTSKTGSSRTSFKIAKIPTPKFSQPKGVKVRKLAGPKFSTKTRKLAVSKIPKIKLG